MLGEIPSQVNLYTVGTAHAWRDPITSQLIYSRYCTCLERSHHKSTYIQYIGTAHAWRDLITSQLIYSRYCTCLGLDITNAIKVRFYSHTCTYTDACAHVHTHTHTPPVHFLLRAFLQLYEYVLLPLCQLWQVSCELVHLSWL